MSGKTSVPWSLLRDANRVPIPIFSPQADPIMTVFTATSTAQKQLEEGIYIVSADQACYVKIGEDGMGAASGTDFSFFVFVQPLMVRLKDPFLFMRVVRQQAGGNVSFVKVG